MKQYFWKLIFVWAGVMALLFGGSLPAAAQSIFAGGPPAGMGGISDQQLGLQYGSATGLSATDPRLTAARIVRAAIGLLGIIMVIIVFYSGFLWMTAGGNDEKTTTAKGWISASVIGLIIILTAYGLASYVVASLVQATGFGTVPLPF